MRTRLLSILCVVYVLLVLYASVMPFDLHADLDMARDHFEQAWGYWPFGTTRTSRIDLATNFMLYVPMGILVATRLSLRRRSRRSLALLAGVLVSAGTSLTAESAQLFSVSRLTGAHDVLMGVIGGAVGAAVGAALGRATWISLRRELRLRWAARPVSMAGMVLMMMLAADALFPFLPTLDVSTVAKSVKASHFSLTSGLALHTWHHWLLKRGFVYAVLAGLLMRPAGRPGRFRRLRGFILVVGFAAIAECGKLFIISRNANIANVVISACGALAGVWLCAGLARRMSSRALVGWAIVLLAGYVTYIQIFSEDVPFRFAWDPAAMRAKVPSGARWLPLYHYAVSGRANDVCLFVRTLVLLASLAYLGRVRYGSLDAGGAWSRSLRAALLGAGAGLLLELGQFLLPGRVPSVTDVFCFALGAALGCLIPAPRASAPRLQPAEP